MHQLGEMSAALLDVGGEERELTEQRVYVHKGHARITGAKYTCCNEGYENTNDNMPTEEAVLFCFHNMCGQVKLPVRTVNKRDRTKSAKWLA